MLRSNEAFMCRRQGMNRSTIFAVPFTVPFKFFFEIILSKAGYFVFSFKNILVMYRSFLQLKKAGNKFFEVSKIQDFGHKLNKTSNRDKRKGGEKERRLELQFYPSSSAVQKIGTPFR